MESLGEGFKDIVREPGYWTGWFMGDGDRVGDKLKLLSSDQERTQFSTAMRDWGRAFKANFSPELGRVIYAGGDDFLGVIYSDNLARKLDSHEALEWLLTLPAEWQEHGQDITVSTGFVWTGHGVPQRDVLQHCREAEKRAKTLGRNRVTIRVVFNSGQYVQWTCPWDYLDILKKYRDREGRTWGNPDLNWTHLYSDWAHLKARHAIRFEDVGRNLVDADLGISLLDFYFNDIGSIIRKEGEWTKVAGADTDSAILQWIDELIQVGWQLCSNI